MWKERINKKIEEFITITSNEINVIIVHPWYWDKLWDEIVEFRDIDSPDYKFEVDVFKMSYRNYLVLRSSDLDEDEIKIY